MSGAAVVATIVVSLTAAWGVGEVAGYRRSLADHPREAPTVITRIWKISQDNCPSHKLRDSKEKGKTERADRAGVPLVCHRDLIREFGRITGQNDFETNVPSDVRAAEIISKAT
jgi:hypothetical protein